MTKLPIDPTPQEEKSPEKEVDVGNSINTPERSPEEKIHYPGNGDQVKNPWDVRVNLRYNREILAKIEEICELFGVDPSRAASCGFWWALLEGAEGYARMRGQVRDQVRAEIKRWKFTEKELYY